ncbi:hypothetical protein CC86DRAFT_306879, partial [Ophiobolus disseminans]
AMSGLEIAGVILGSFPLIISSIERWHNMAKIGGYLMHIKKEYRKCRSDARYYEVAYRNNLEELLLPNIMTRSDLDELLKDPGGNRWKNDQALQHRLEERLHGSYSVYQDLMLRLKETTEALAEELLFESDALQGRLVLGHNVKMTQPPPKRASMGMRARENINFQMFRMKFSLRESVRDGLFAQLKEYNERLQHLMHSSGRLQLLQKTAEINLGSKALEARLQKIWRSSDLLFRALQLAWQCPCRESHVANLRLEHQNASEICFEIILMFMATSDPSPALPWTWHELQCGYMPDCGHSYATPAASPCALPYRTTSKSHNLTPADNIVPYAKGPARIIPTIRFADIPNTMQLCNGLASITQKSCMGVVSHEDLLYHLHPLRKRQENTLPTPVTLDHILSRHYEGDVSLRQRITIATLLASAVVQLTFTPWLRNRLKKSDIIFFQDPNAGTDLQLDEPFICQAFDNINTSEAAPGAKELNFFSLGVLLVELCFGKRLEDSRIRQDHPVGDAESKKVYDLVAALKWSHSVGENAGEDYARAVGWCFTSGGVVGKSWRSDVSVNVVQPLRQCLEYLKIPDGT